MMTMFRKGFEGTPEKLKQFVNALHTSSFDIYCSVNKDKARVPVDSNIFLTHSQDLDLWEEHQVAPPEFGKKDHLEALEFLRLLEKHRDAKIGSIDLDYLGLNEVSYFLKDHVQENFVPRNYLTREKELLHVYEGNKPMVAQQYAGKGKITTLRDGARFVRNDPAVHVWADNVVDTLLKEGAKVRTELFLPNFKEGSQMNFSVMGLDIKAMYWEAAQRISRLSFRSKYHHLYPRPEQATYDLNQELLTQCYDRGSPYHPSFYAMHSMIYFTLFHLTIFLFDDQHIMGNGKTLYHNARVLAENGAYWRSVAGVHYMFDNTMGEPLTQSLALRVVEEKLDQF